MLELTWNQAGTKLEASWNHAGTKLEPSCNEAVTKLVLLLSQLMMLAAAAAVADVADVGCCEMTSWMPFASTPQTFPQGQPRGVASASSA